MLRTRGRIIIISINSFYLIIIMMLIPEVSIYKFDLIMFMAAGYDVVTNMLL